VSFTVGVIFFCYFTFVNLSKEAAMGEKQIKYVYIIPKTPAKKIEKGFTPPRPPARPIEEGYVPPKAPSAPPKPAPPEKK
jgi:hypothetical protein